MFNSYVQLPAMFNYQRVKKSLGLVKYGWFDQKTIIRDN